MWKYAIYYKNFCPTPIRSCKCSPQSKCDGNRSVIIRLMNGIFGRASRKRLNERRIKNPSHSMHVNPCCEFRSFKSLAVVINHSGTKALNGAGAGMWVERGGCRVWGWLGPLEDSRRSSARVFFLNAAGHNIFQNIRIKLLSSPPK